MAIWEVRVVYRNGDRFWENVWHLDIGSATDVSSTMIDAFRDFARNTLLSIYTVERIVRRPAGTSDAFIETIIGLAGLVAIGGDKALPLFNTVKVLLNAGAGRPGIKYIRGLIRLADVLDNQNHLTTTLVSAVQSQVDDLFNTASDESVTFVEGADDKPVANPIVQTIIQMRQPHRKRRASV